eukprot:4849511-Amphidinium_carterae.1
MQPMRLGSAWLDSGMHAGTHETPNIRRDDQLQLLGGRHSEKVQHSTGTPLVESRVGGRG